MRPAALAGACATGPLFSRDLAGPVLARHAYATISTTIGVKK